MNLIVKFKEGFDESLDLSYSQACKVMFDGGTVYLPSEPAGYYMFDGAEGYRVWRYVEDSDDLIHIDNVTFAQMMRGDWKVKEWGRLGRRIMFRDYLYAERLSVVWVSTMILWCLISGGMLRDLEGWPYWITLAVNTLILYGLDRAVKFAKKRLINGKII